MGSGVVRDLVSKHSEGVEKVIVADLRLDKAKEIVNELNDSRLEARFIDVKDLEKTKKLLKEVDACANAGYFRDTNLPLMQACLEAKCPYTDLGGMGVVTMEQKKKFHKKYLEAGVSAVLGMGSAPGITNVLAGYVADQLDSVEKVSLYWVGDYKGPESLVFVPPYSILTLMEEYADTSYQFLNGKLTLVPSAVEEGGKQVVFFPPPIGVVECVHSAHSEVATVPDALKNRGLKEMTWRLRGTNYTDAVIKALISCGFGDREPMEYEGKKIVPARFLQKVIERNIEKNKDKIPQPKYGEYEAYDIYRGTGEGIKGGKRATCIIDCLANYSDDRFEGYNDASTSIPLSITAQMLAKEEVSPGVWGGESIDDKEKFFKELEKRKFDITVTKIVPGM